MTEPDNRTATEQPEAFSFSVRSFHAALRFAQGMGMLTVLLGLIVLAGWAFHIESLKTVLPGYVSMKANTALCFALSGTALLIGYLSRPRRLEKNLLTILALLVVLIAGVTLLEYGTNRRFGIDELLFSDSPNRGLHLQPGTHGPQYRHRLSCSAAPPSSCSPADRAEPWRRMPSPWAGSSSRCWP